jgi:hypothetical protein
VKDTRVAETAVAENDMKLGNNSVFVPQIEVDSIHSTAVAEMVVVEDSVMLVFVDRLQYSTLSTEKDEKEHSNGS